MRNMRRCTGAIPTRRRRGRWSAAPGCGSDVPATRTSASSGSASAPVRCATPLVLPEPGAGRVEGPGDGGRRSHRLVADRSTVPGLPVTVDLCAHPRIVVDGSAGRGARAGAGAWCASWPCCTAPTSLEIAASSAVRATREWDWLKWLPHHGRFVVGPDRGLAGWSSSTAVGPDDDVAHGAGVTLVRHRRSCDRRRAASRRRTAVAALERPDALTPTAGGRRAPGRLARFCRDPHAAAGAADWPDLVGIGDPARIDARPDVAAAAAGGNGCGWRSG